MHSCGSAAAAVVGFACLALLAPPAAAQGVKAEYMEALGREDVLRSDLGTQRTGVSAPLLRRIRMLVREYERLARRFPASGYSDNALYQGAVLSADAFWQYGDDTDRRTALRLFTALRADFPTSSLVNRIAHHTVRLEAAAKPAAPDEATTLKAIRRESLPDTLRVILELERETPYRDERLDGPPRVFIDLRNARASAELRDAAFGFPDDVVRQIRVGRRQGAMRVVLDLQGAPRHSVYALYNPYRVVIDFDRPAGAVAEEGTTAERAKSVGPANREAANSAAREMSAAPARPDPATAERASDADSDKDEPGATWAPEPTASSPVAPDGGARPIPESRATAPLSSSGRPSSPAGAVAVAPAVSPAGTSARATSGSSPTAPPSAPDRNAASDASPPPAPPATNSKGGFSLSRQLGLGISRVVIDAGHGGHDPGARVKGLNEADVTLDVALRVEKLLLQVPGVEVILTRRTNVYVPLEERTAIANRAGADLFLSIHVNAARNPRVRGIETYFLNFAPSKEAEAVAARENAGSSKTMSNLPDIVKAIALNNKIDESRDFAALVQTAMIDRLRKSNRDARNLGVKQAPFMVLIGATMPSVLAEISFLTNRQEASLLKTPTYRQAIADALVAGISRYQRSLKNAQPVASQ